MIYESKKLETNMTYRCMVYLKKYPIEDVLSLLNRARLFWVS